jgi:hypothetical protein
MAIVCEDFNNLLENYSKTVPDHNLLFRVTKSCGYSQLVVVSKYDISKFGSHIALLQHQIGLHMGNWARDKVYFYAKTDTPFPSAEKTYVWQIYHPDIYRNDIPDKLPEFARHVLPTAYTVDECRYPVYQLYIDSPCECNIPHPHAPSPPPPPASPTTIPRPMSINDLDYVV